MQQATEDLDVVIVGAGPAGISAAIWCADLGLRAVVLEKAAEAGGQLLNIYNPVTNYPGLRADNGRQIRDRFMETAENYGIRIHYSTEAARIDPEKGQVDTVSGERFSARCIIAATGVRRRRLGVPGEKEFVGRGVIESGSRDRELTRGKTVAIAGGGDAALENALILAEYADMVYVIHRRRSFSARREFVQAAVERPNIEMIMSAAVARVGGSDRVESVEITNTASGEKWAIAADIFLARIGVEPRNELLAPLASLDPAGYVKVGPEGRSSVGGLFAAGDIANPVSPTIVSAAGMGAAAAKGIAALLERRLGG